MTMKSSPFRRLASTTSADNTDGFGYGATNTSPQFIGDSHGFANYNGQLDDLRVYGRALTNAEIALLHTHDPR